jgi:hypothetical protein
VKVVMDVPARGFIWYMAGGESCVFFFWFFYADFSFFFGGYED